MLAVTLGIVFAPGLGAAISPMAIVAELILLTTTAGRARAYLFTLGVFVSTLAFAFLVLVVLLSFQVDSSDTGSRIAAGFSVILGFLLMWFAVRQWVSRPARGEDAVTPKWMSTLDTASGLKAFTVGVALSFLNAKNVPLTIATVTAVVHRDAPLWANVVAIIFFAALGSLGVVVPIVGSLVGGTVFETKLQDAKAFLVQHNAVILSVVFLMLGAQMAGKAIGNLFM
jgi:threonine/homoserine/homoserine lactone efflux protein